MRTRPANPLFNMPDSAGGEDGDTSFGNFISSVWQVNRHHIISASNAALV